MTVYFFTGTDSGAISNRITNLTADSEGHVERFDLTSPDDLDWFVQSAGARGLFGAKQYLIAAPVAQLTRPVAEQIAKTIDSATTLIFHGETAARPTVEKVFPNAVTETFAPPTAYTAKRRVEAAARDMGVAPTTEALDVLAHVAPTHWALVQQVLDHCAQLGPTRPDVEDVRPFLGSARGQIFPWVLLDALIAGDRLLVLDAADVLEPFSTLGYLSSRMALIGKIVEFTGVSDEEIGRRLSLSKTAVRQLLPIARRLGTAGVARTWQLLSQAEADFKTGDSPQNALRVLLMKLTTVLAA